MKNKWWVTGISLDDKTLFVHCKLTNQYGIVKDITKEERRRAFHAINHYRWRHDSRVIKENSSPFGIVNMTKSQIRFLESKFTEYFQDAIEILSIENHEDNRHLEKNEMRALIIYDGTNDKANKGYVYFKCHRGWINIKNQKVEDITITNVTGSNYIRKIFELPAEV